MKPRKIELYEEIRCGNYEAYMDDIQYKDLQEVTSALDICTCNKCYLQIDSLHILLNNWFFDMTYFSPTCNEAIGAVCTYTQHL